MLAAKTRSNVELLSYYNFRFLIISIIKVVYLHTQRNEHTLRLHDELLLYIDFSRDVCYSTHRVRSKANTNEQSIHNSYESCNLFIQSN